MSSAATGRRSAGRGRGPLALQQRQIDDVHAGQRGDAGVDVPGQRQVDDDQRPAAAAGHGGGDDVGVDDEPGGAGAGDQHVGGGQLGRQVGERGGAAAEALGQPGGAWPRCGC